MHEALRRVIGKGARGYYWWGFSEKWGKDNSGKCVETYKRLLTLPSYFSFFPNLAIACLQNSPVFLSFSLLCNAHSATLSTMARTTYAPRIEASQWEAYREPILNFYLKEKQALPETMEDMERDYGFVAT